MILNEEKTEINLYSCYGYVNVIKSEYNSDNDMIKFTKDGKNPLNGTIRKKSLSDFIIIKLKTLYGDRKIYSFELKIQDKLKNIIEKLLDLEKNNIDDESKWKFNNQYRIYSSNGYIKELNPDFTLASLKIKHNEVFILAKPMKLGFSQIYKGQDITIESGISLASKISGDEYEYALCDRGYYYGKNYSEFTLDTEPLERNVMIGISLKRNDYYMCGSEYHNFWGYIPSECRKIYSNDNNENEDYGDVCKIGDKIGLLLEFDEMGLNVSFFLNGINMGLAFSKLPNNTYYPCIIMLYEGTRIKVSNDLPFPVY